MKTSPKKSLGLWIGFKLGCLSTRLLNAGRAIEETCDNLDIMIKILILPIISSVLLAAHFSRIDLNWLVPLALLFPLILLIKRKWIIRIYQFYLICGGIIWIERLFYLRSLRIAVGESWILLVSILGAVVLITLLSALMLQNKKVLNAYQPEKKEQ